MRNPASRCISISEIIPECIDLFFWIEVFVIASVHPCATNFLYASRISVLNNASFTHRSGLYTSSSVGITLKSPVKHTGLFCASSFSA